MPRDIPTYPADNFFTGNMPSLQADTLGFLEDLATLGDVVRFRSGPVPLYFVNHPDYLREILVTQSDRVQKSQLFKYVFKDSVGKNILTSDGDYWRQQRRLMQPIFHKQRIRQFADTMVTHTQAMLDTWQIGEQRDISDEMSRLTLGITTDALFSRNMRDSPAGDAFSGLFTRINERLQRTIFVPNWIPNQTNRAIKRHVETITRELENLIADRRAADHPGDDLLGMLLAAQREDDLGLSDEQVFNEAVTIFGAGFETTSFTLAWTLSLLAQHPDVESAVYDEIQRVTGDDTPSLDHADDLTYTQQVIDEAMRLYPVAAVTTRDTVAELPFGEFVIPANRMVMFSNWTLHRDSRFWEQPQQFQPARFAPDADHHKYAFLPFGGGGRICLGQHFAMLEMQLVLATILQRVRLDLASGHTVTPDYNFTLRPEGGVLMTIHPRTNLN